MFKRSLNFLLMIFALLPAMAAALEFKSVAADKTILYDAPSASAKKIYILSQYYPLEIIVDLGAWQKVRDAEGAISWVEAKSLSVKKTVLVTAANADIRLEPDAASKLLATVEKNVALELLEAKPANGWLKIQHRDGVTGYISVRSIWGAN